MPPITDIAREIIGRVPTTDKKLQAYLWDAFYGAKDEAEFKKVLDGVTIPKRAKAALWDAKFGTPPVVEELPQLFTEAQVKPPAKGIVPWLQGLREKLLQEGIPSIGMPPLAGGVPREVAEFMGGPALGPIDIATGVSRVFQDPQERPFGRRALAGGTEILRGGFETVAPFFGLLGKGAAPTMLLKFEALTRGAEPGISRLPVSEEAKGFLRIAVPLVAMGIPEAMKRVRAKAREVVKPEEIELVERHLLTALPPPKGLLTEGRTLVPERPPGSVLGALDRTEFKVTTGDPTATPRSLADIPEAVEPGPLSMVRPIKGTEKPLSREAAERTFLEQPEGIPTEPRLVMAPTDVTKFFEPPTPTSRQLPVQAGPSREIPGRLPGAAQAKEPIALPAEMPPVLKNLMEPPVSLVRRGKRTYEEVQREIDALEEKPGAEKQVEALYQEREAIGAGELSESLADIQGRLAKSGIRGKDAEAVLDYYSLRPGKVGATEQYFAAEYTEKFAQRPISEQVEGVAIKLAAERGELFDAVQDISARTKKDAALAVREVAGYFRGVEPTRMPKPQPISPLEAKPAAKGIEPTPVSPQEIAELSQKVGRQVTPAEVLAQRDIESRQLGRRVEEPRLGRVSPPMPLQRLETKPSLKAAERAPEKPSLIMKGITKKEVVKRKKLIERGKVKEEIPEVYRTMPLESLKGFAKQGVRAAKQELKRRTRGERVPEDAEAFDLGLQANPIFNPKVWETMDRSLSQTVVKPIIEKIKRGLGAVVEKLPPEVGDFIKRQLAYHKEAERIIKNAALEVDLRKDLNEQLLRIVLKDKPTPEELLVADRLSRGVPADLKPGNLKENTQKVAEAFHRHAQKMTAEREALGLPIREEWMEGPKSWYPNLWKQHLFSPKMVAGRLFGFLKGGRRFKPPGKEELGSVKYPRRTDRWWVTDSTGKLVKIGKGFAIFKEKAAAERFVASNTGYVLQFFEKGKGRQLQELRFNKVGARSEWIKKNRDNITIRRAFKDEPLRIVEPMTHEQAVAHGLIEDLVMNVRHGFGREISLLAKTKALARLGKELAVDEPLEGFVNLTERGFSIPKALADRNADIARLRDGYVPKDVADTILAFYGKTGYVSRWTRRYSFIEGQMRKWVTIRAPWRHVRQFGENELMLAFADPRASLNVFAKRRAAKEFIQGARGGERTKLYNEYRNSILIEEDFFRGEFQDIWSAVGKRAPLEKATELSLYERTLIAADNNMVARKFLQLDNLAQKLYRAEDQLYKFYLYKTLRERGMAKEAAVDRVSNSFFDYLHVPPIVKATNRIVPFMPNVAFQFARIFSTALRDRPATSTLKIALAVHSWFFMREKFMEMAGIDEEKLKEMGDLAPGWHEVVLPITDSKGKNIKVSLLWLLPYGEIFMMADLLRAYDIEQTISGSLRRFVPMVVQPLMTLVSLKGPFGQRILRGTETGWRAAKKLAGAMALGWAPGLAGQYWYRLYQNATAGPEKKQPWWLQGLVEPVTGRVEAFRPEEKIDLARGLEAGKYGRLAREIRRIQRKVIKGTASAADMEELRYLKGQVREFQKREKK